MHKADGHDTVVFNPVSHHRHAHAEFGSGFKSVGGNGFYKISAGFLRRILRFFAGPDLVWVAEGKPACLRVHRNKEKRRHGTVLRIMLGRRPTQTFVQGDGQRNPQNADKNEFGQADKGGVQENSQWVFHLVSAQCLQKRVKRDFSQKAVRVGDIAAVSAPKYFLRCFDDVRVSGGKCGKQRIYFGFATDIVRQCEVWETASLRR